MKETHFLYLCAHTNIPGASIVTNAKQEKKSHMTVDEKGAIRLTANTDSKNVRQIQTVIEAI